MKKFFSLFAAAFIAVSLFAEPVTVTFKDWGLAPNNTSGDYDKAYTTANIKDSIEGAAFIDTFTVATKVYAARVNMGAKFGSSKATGKIQFVLATPAEFDSIVFSAASYSTSEGSVSICGGEAIDLTNGGTLNKIMQNLVYRPTGVVDTITFETTQMRAFLKSITFYPKANPGEGGDNPGEGGDNPGEGGETAGITYELNGGTISNYYSAQDMYADLNADYNAAMGTTATWLPLAECTGPKQGIPTAVATIDIPFFTTDGSKWKWLVDYLDVVSAQQSVAVASSSSATLRYNLQSFFKDWQYTGWPKSADYTTCGVSTPSAYQSLWKSGFANPTNPTDTFALNEPYREGFTFDGWYAAADFSGAKVTTVDATTTGTLYAKWIEYIPTLAEVKAMAIDTETKASGVVTFINIGKSSTNIYVQDATGGLLLFTKTTNTTLNVGDKVVVRGKMATFNGAPELVIIDIVSAEASTLPAAKKFDTFAAACDSTFTNLFTRVSFMGLKITSLDSYNNPYVTDGVDTLQCYRMSVDSTFKVGDKVNVTAILGYYNNNYQLVGDVKGIEHIMLGVKDQYNYPARGEYTLENKWLISVTEDNYESNRPGVTKAVRGMVTKDGIMYFINQTYGSLVRVDGASGTMLDPIKITGDHLFEALDTTDNSYKAAVTLAFNDIKLDGAGNCLIGACVTGSQHFMIYKVNLATGAATLLIDEKLVDNDDFVTTGADGSRSWGGRFDAFGVYGDVNSDAIIMAADAKENSFYVYKWTITNGVAGPAEQIDCALEPSSDQSLIIQKGEVTAAGFSYASQIFPIDEDYFYVDGFNTLPMLYNMDGNLVDDFINSPKGVKVGNNEGDTCTMNTAHNGLCEFQVGDEYFMVMAATGTDGRPASAFALYKFANSSKSFAGLEPLWYFPANGMGAASNECRTAVPSVEVNGNKATIYLYTAENGYGVYEFTGKEAASAIENTEATEVTKIFENGQVYIIKNGVRYNVLGTVVEK